MPRTTTLAALGAVAALAAAAPFAVSHAQPGPGAGDPPGRGDRGPRGAAMMFERMDANRDGRVTWEETWTFVQGRFAQADRDGSGGLTQEEMQAAMREGLGGGRRAAPAAAPGGGAEAAPPAGDDRREERRAEGARRFAGVFRALDADRNGQVTLNEIRPAMEARFRALDANADNAVTRDELPQGHHGGRRDGGGDRERSAPTNPG